MHFHRDINGLRAIAVISVVCFHFFPNIVPGGFIGVDIFFVISGFLMAKVIFLKIYSEDFALMPALMKFYQARVKRIMPALAWLCLALLVWGYWQFSTPLLAEVSKQSLSSVLFVSNFVYLFDVGYFDAAAQNKWLLHTWSLSVEWQFYLLYPIFLLVIMHNLNYDWLRRIMLIATIISFLLSVYLSDYFGFHSNPTLANAGYYLLPTRLWEMLMGGLAYCYGCGKFRLSWDAKIMVTRLSLIAIVASFWLVSEQTPWPGFWTLLPVLATYLVITFYFELVPPPTHHAVITSKPMQAIGRWSYSIYLWHWPMVVAGGYYQLSYWWLFGPLLSVILGWFSYKFIEQPSRPKLNIAVFIAVLLLSGWPIVNKWQQNSAKQVAHLSYPSSICEGFTDYCQTYGSDKSQPIDFIIWGDSHSKVLARALALEGYHLAVFTSLGCPPINGIRRVDGMGGDSGCNSKINDRIYQHLLLKSTIDTTSQLILIGRWSVYHWGWHKNGQLQKANHYLCYEDCHTLVASSIAAQFSLGGWQRGLEDTIEGLTPHYQLTVFKGGPSLKVRGIDYHDAKWQQLSIDEHLAYQQATDEVIDKLSNKYAFNTIEHGRLWFEDGKMKMYHDQDLLFNDDNHPTLKAWQVIMPSLVKQLEQKAPHLNNQSHDNNTDD